MAGSTTEAIVGRVATSIEPPVARLTLNHLPLNVIDFPMMDDLTRTLAQIEADPGISIVLICGAGKAFSAGVDVAAHTPDKVEEMLAKFHGVIRTLLGSRKITVAQVHGPCLGGGAELAMVCDLVYTAGDAHWAFPEIKLGCYPPVACAALASLVGQKRAADLIFTGRSISGREAAAIGLATESVAPDRVESAASDCIQRLRILSPAALSVTKKAFYAWDAAHFDKGLAHAEKIYLEELMKTADAPEGIRAFMEKRSPKWLNQ